MYPTETECEYGKPIFDDYQDETGLPKSLDSAVQFDSVNDETSTIPSTDPANCPERFHQDDVLHEGTETDQDTSYRERKIGTS